MYMLMIWGLGDKYVGIKTTHLDDLQLNACIYLSINSTNIYFANNDGQQLSHIINPTTPNTQTHKQQHNLPSERIALKSA